MRVLLVGCGGIGGIVAASLAKSGTTLDIITGNPEIQRAIQTQGLRVRELDSQEWSTPATGQVVASAGELARALAAYDLCLLSTKTTTLEAALHEVKPLLQPQADVVLLQNGLPEERAEAILGHKRVIGCVVGWGATLVEPGFSARTSRGGLQLGRRRPMEGEHDAGLQRATDLLGSAFATRMVRDLDGVRWSKLAINCATSTLGAAGGDTLGRLLRQRFVRRLALEVWGELAHVARAEGIKLAKVAGTLDIDKLAITDAERRMKVGSPALFLKHSLLLAIGLKFRRMRSSMGVAISRGRKPEIDFLNGEIVRRGQRLGIATPVNHALVTLIHDIVAGTQRPGLNTLYDLYRRTCTPDPTGTSRSQPALPPLAPQPSETQLDRDR
ncbi:MAG: 2-dehydropantoate 2-reductase [Myxococcales bacterium]|nr:2-dehydropantoate 2-reductase [Myxococcales bacterium]